MTDSIPSRNDDDAELFRDLYFREQQSKLEAQDKAGAVSSTAALDATERRYTEAEVREACQKVIDDMLAKYGPTDGTAKR